MFNLVLSRYRRGFGDVSVLGPYWINLEYKQCIRSVEKRQDKILLRIRYMNNDLKNKEQHIYEVHLPD